MGILTRFTDIISANVNALLDKVEDPSKMVDQYLRKMNADLAEVKKETAGVMAEESRSKRLMEENEKEVAKYAELAKKALLAQNENDAHVFIAKKQSSEVAGAGLKMAHAVANENAIKMRQLHDKLVKDINALNAKRQTIKAKDAVAKTTQRINELNSSVGKSDSSKGAFRRMEEQVDRKLDEANALAELDSTPINEAQSLELKYQSVDIDESVANELAALKSQLGIN
ncbi:MAG: PspA/IM30 family protein [Defluviitaleaceae bacterium]|nr:PspA/IM30 family protein [Defluviitaleaceae bacterium]